MLSNDKLRYFDFTTHHSRFTTTKSSVQCHFDFEDVAVSFCLYIAWNSLILNTDKKIHSPFHRFVLGKWMSRLFRIPRISTHITTFHSLVRFLLIILLALFIFLSDVQKLSKLIKKNCHTQLWPMSDNISFKVDVSRELKVI